MKHIQFYLIVLLSSNYLLASDKIELTPKEEHLIQSYCKDENDLKNYIELFRQAKQHRQCFNPFFPKGFVDVQSADHKKMLLYSVCVNDMRPYANGIRPAIDNINLTRIPQEANLVYTASQNDTRFHGIHENIQSSLNNKDNKDCENQYSLKTSKEKANQILMDLKKLESYQKRSSQLRLPNAPECCIM